MIIKVGYQGMKPLKILESMNWLFNSINLNSIIEVKRTTHYTSTILTLLSHCILTHTPDVVWAIAICSTHLELVSQIP